MLRTPYIGDTQVGVTPIQPEARALFARMTTPPSKTYRDAMNWAIWRWKQIGVWPLIKGLWVLAADTPQAALLSVIGDTPRDAVIVGTSPTFTALKGYSGFGAGKVIRFPITAAILGSTSVCSAVAARIVPRMDGGGAYVRDMLVGSGADVHGIGNFWYILASTVIPFGAGTGVITSGTNTLLVSGSDTVSMHLIGGSKEFSPITAGGIGGLGASGTLGALPNNPATAAVDFTALDRLWAYGFLGPTATLRQCQAFFAILAELLGQLGAMD